LEARLTEALENVVAVKASPGSTLPREQREHANEVDAAFSFNPREWGTSEAEAGKVEGLKLQNLGSQVQSCQEHLLDLQEELRSSIDLMKAKLGKVGVEGQVELPGDRDHAITAQLLQDLREDVQEAMEWQEQSAEKTRSAHEQVSRDANHRFDVFHEYCVTLQAKCEKKQKSVEDAADSIQSKIELLTMLVGEVLENKTKLDEFTVLHEPHRLEKDHLGITYDKMNNSPQVCASESKQRNDEMRSWQEVVPALQQQVKPPEQVSSPIAPGLKGTENPGPPCSLSRGESLLLIADGLFLTNEKSNVVIPDDLHAGQQLGVSARPLLGRGRLHRSLSPDMRQGRASSPPPVQATGKDLRRHT